MKGLFIKTLLFLTASAISHRNIRKDVGTAISEVVLNSFDATIETIDIVICASNEKLYEDTISIILTRNKEKAFRLIYVDPSGEFTYNYKDLESAILLFDSFVLFRYFTRRLIQQAQKVTIFPPIRRRNIVYSHNWNEKEISSMAYQNLARYQNFLFQENDTLQLKEIQLFSPSHCRSIKWITINTFPKNSVQWESKVFLSKPVNNYHGCEVVFGVRLNSPLEYFKKNVSKGGIASFKFNGLNNAIYKTLERSLNFTAFLNPILRRMPFYPNKVIDARSANVVTESNSSYITQPYVFNSLQFIVPPGESYTAFEKLFLAFDDFTWIMIVFTFAVAFIIIFCFAFVPKKVQQMAFGSRVNAAWFNVIAVFFGNGQTNVPRKGFARFLLMTFILYSLIIRTAYQGKSFEFLQMDVHKKPIQSIGEMFANCSVCIPDNYLDFSKNTLHEESVNWFVLILN